MFGKSVFGVVCVLGSFAFGCARGPHALPAAPTAAEPMPELGEAAITAATTSSDKTYEKGCASGRIDTRASELYAKACRAGDGEGCRKASQALRCADRDRNAAASFAFAERACALHEESGCRIVAGALVEGRDVPRDTTRALRVLDASCARGDAQSCGAIGGILMINGNIDRGVPYLTKACDGDADACANLAVVEAQGLGGRAKDPEHAISLAKRACEAKSMFGCQTLGFIFASGIGDAPDWQKAHALFAIACEGGNGQGCLNLAKCQAEGLGTKEDDHAAMASLQKSCDLGHGAACRVLADVTPRSAPTNGMSPVMF